MHAPTPTLLDDIIRLDAAPPALTADAVVGPRHDFDAYDDADAVIRAAFRSRQIDGREPHVVEMRLDPVDEAATMLPSDAAVLRSVVTQAGDTLLLARGRDYTILTCTDTHFDVSVSAPTRARAAEVADGIRARLPAPLRDDRTTWIHTWHRGTNGPRWKGRRIEVPAWAGIARNYPSATREAIDRLQQMVRPAGTGRLVLWHGPPGTGKTTALRALFRAWAGWCDVHYVTDPEALFAEPDYLYELLAHSGGDGRAKLVVAEDSDEFLRTGAPLGRLLNVTDGVLGQGADTFVLLTTNEELRRLHPALVRPGRCLAAIEFGRFEPGEAAEWLGDGHVAPTTAKALADLFVQRGDLERVEVRGAQAGAARTGLYL